jgi:hypothetical protein
MTKDRSTNEVYEALRVAWSRSKDPARRARLFQQGKRIVAALRTLHGAMQRVGLNLKQDPSTPSGIRAWHTMADDHDSPKAWLAAARAFRRVTKVQLEAERELARKGR